MHPTKTTNRLHFTDLEPLRFEDLCLNIIQRQKDWKDIRHYGRSGSDEGIDILGIDKKKMNHGTFNVKDTNQLQRMNLKTL